MQKLWGEEIYQLVGTRYTPIQYDENTRLTHRKRTSRLQLVSLRNTVFGQHANSKHLSNWYVYWPKVIQPNPILLKVNILHAKALLLKTFSSLNLNIKHEKYSKYIAWSIYKIICINIILLTSLNLNGMKHTYWCQILVPVLATIFNLWFRFLGFPLLDTKEF